MPCRASSADGAWKSAPLQRGEVPIRGPRTAKIACYPFDWIRCCSSAQKGGATSGSGQNEPCHSLRRHGRSTSVTGPAEPAAGAAESGHNRTHARQQLRALRSPVAADEQCSDEIRRRTRSFSTRVLVEY